mmetsp:Transcript_43731/g.79824  ORF Transcript_43731/g.79824 Transcript_43731/m.79824 type:complete len:471 (-) Transcript_43731:71-1483(-)
MQATNSQKGLSIVQELSLKSHGGVAEWLLDQIALLSRDDVAVEELPIFHVAAALQAVPVLEKQRLVESAVQGFGSLPPGRRAEAVRLAMQAQGVIQQAENLELTRLAEREHAKAMQRLAALEQAGSSRSPYLLEASSHAGGGSAANGVPQISEGVTTPRARATPLVENLLRVAKEARFNEMPKEELVMISHSAQAEATRVVQPQHLLDVVTELNSQEREQLTSALVDAHVVPEGQRGVLEEAIRPGGYADKLAGALALAKKLKPYAWVALGLPALEFVLSLIMSLFSCGVPLAAWLRADAILMLCLVGAGFATSHIFSPVYAKLEEDPFGTVQRWQTAGQDPHKARNLEARLRTAVPNVALDTYRYTALGVAICALLFLLGAAWAILGVVYLLGALAWACSPPTFIVCTAFVGLRFCLVIGMVLLLFYLLDEIQKHRSRQVLLANIPLTEEAQVHEPLLKGPSAAAGEKP